MKCPKCDYLGFETGDRCKNCGYDFSLLTVAESGPLDYDRGDPADYEIHPAAIDDVPVHVIDDITPQAARDELDDELLIAPAPMTASAVTSPPEPAWTPEPAIAEEPEPEAVEPVLASDEAVTPTDLPLFKPAVDADDDEPLIKLPATPRPPLAVRRTPDTPRLRAVPRPTSSRPAPAPVLQFAEEPLERAVEEEQEPVAARDAAETSGSVITGQPSRPGARIVALLIDHLILGGIDVGVLYFTLRMAGLSMGEWRLLPAAPMLTFLGLVKVAYFYAFTAVGGQTIGKMAVGTCVVAEGGAPVDAARALRRTFAGTLSFLLLGLGFIPALFGDHRALHDRVAGTRVVRLRSV